MDAWMHGCDIRRHEHGVVVKVYEGNGLWQR